LILSEHRLYVLYHMYRVWHKLLSFWKWDNSVKNESNFKFGFYLHSQGSPIYWWKITSSIWPPSKFRQVIRSLKLRITRQQTSPSISPSKGVRSHDLKGQKFHEVKSNGPYQPSKVGHRSWTSQIVRFEEYWKRIFICTSIKFSWFKKWNQLIMGKGKHLLNGFWVNNNRIKTFSRRIIFIDVAHFHLSGYVNKQNRRIWGTKNPK